MLYKDLVNIGAEVFQFQQNATPGQPAWTEVLTKIENADVFILLASKNAVKSKPVQEEIKFAHYQYINTSKPSILLPLVLEPNLQLPREIRANNLIDFQDYKKGFAELARLLQPDPPPKAPTYTQRVGTPKTPFQRAPFPGVGERSPLQAKASSMLKGNYASLAKAEMIWYAIIIIIIGVAGAFLGQLASNLLVQFSSNSISERVANYTYSHPWLLWVSKLVCWVAIAYKSYDIADDEYPIDKIDYAGVAAKAVALSVVTGLIWTFLFVQVTSTYPFILICTAIAVVTLLVYAVLDVYF